MIKKIGYDLSFLGDRRITGVERFSIEIYKKLKDDDNLNYICFLPSNFPNEWVNTNVENVFTCSKNKHINHFIFLPYYSIKMNLNSIILPAFPPTIFFKFVNVNLIRVIHDDVMWSKESTLSFIASKYLKPLENYWLDKYKKIITVSDFSRKRIEDLCYRMFNKYKSIDVVNNGFEINKYGFRGGENGKYILCVGTIEPRKNYHFAIDLFEKLHQEDTSLNLIICGREGWGYEDLVKKTNRSKLKEKIKILTSVEDKDLMSLYHDCKLLLFPSSYEGFGIPLIEAMAMGKKVIAANNSAITEVVADGGVLVDGYNLDTWVKAYKKLLNEDYHELAINQAKRFTWDRSYENLKKYLEEI